MDNGSEAKAFSTEHWQPVDPRYSTQLRLYLSAPLLVSLAAAAGASYADQSSLAWAAAAVALALVVMITLWVPRRVKYTCYRLLDTSMNMRIGFWWQTQTAVSINRIQHLEITQGPLERGLGLGKLVLYTAGGMRSDLQLPGLKLATAEDLKQVLLERIAEEKDGSWVSADAG